MIFFFKGMIFMFHVSFPGSIGWSYPTHSRHQDEYSFF